MVVPTSILHTLNGSILHVDNESHSVYGLSKPQNVGILGIEVYFPRRVHLVCCSAAGGFDSPVSAYQRRTLKFSTALRRANTQLVLVKNIWLAQMTARTLTRLP